MQNHPHPNRPNNGSFWTGRGTSAIVRVHGNQRPAHLRGYLRSDWMVR